MIIASIEAQGKMSLPRQSTVPPSENEGATDLAAAGPSESPRDGCDSLEQRLARAQAEGLQANLERFLSFLGVPPEAPSELQALDVKDGRWTNHQFAFVRADEAFRLASEIEDDAVGTYVILNEANEAVFTRAQSGTWHVAKKGGTTDSDITHRRALFVDVDAVRSPGTSATDEEMQHAAKVAAAIYELLANLLGEAVVGYGHSGNGRSLFVALSSIPETDDLKATANQILKCLSIIYSNDKAHVDVKVGDPKRLVPAFGTIKRKGAPGIPERPHRRTAFICHPDPVSCDLDALAFLLEELIARVPPDRRSELDRQTGRSPRKAAVTNTGTPKAPSPSRRSEARPAAAGPFAAANGVNVMDVLAWKGLLSGPNPVCPGCGLTAGVSVVANGVKCHHSRCADKGKDGFRTCVDIVVEADGLTPMAAAEKIIGQFGLAAASAAPVPASSEYDDPHLTDLGNAERLVASYGADIRYCHPWGSWLVWDGRRWNTDDKGHISALANATVRSIYAEAGSSTDQTRRVALAEHATKSEFRRALEAMIVLARSLPAVPVLPSDLDRDPWLLNCGNGTLDLRTGKLGSHDRNDLITKMVPVDFDEAALAPAWEAFLFEILPDASVRSFLQRYVGYSLTGLATERVIAFLYGTGANGKSVFLNVVRKMMGDYAAIAAPDLLMARRGETHPTELADLCGVRLAITSEVGFDRAFDEERVKKLTGNEPIKGRRMKQDFFEIAPTWKLIMAANHRPPVRDSTDSIWDRIRQVPFSVRVDPEFQDKNLTNKLISELPGILAWAVRGCLDWQSDGLREPAPVMAATQNYRRDQDLVGRFLAACSEMDRDGIASAADVLNAYEGWASANAEQVIKQGTLGRRLKERGFDNSAKDGAGRVVWKGFKLNQKGTELALLQAALRAPQRAPRAMP